MTTRTSDRTEQRRPTMADVDHVHSSDPGASVRFYGRGPAAMTDGGEHEAVDPEDEDEREEAHESDDRQTMKDVSHTPPAGDREVNRVFERGEEGRRDGR